MAFSYTSEVEGLADYVPTCFPPYFYQHEGYFLTSTRQAVPRLEKTCGAFRILFVFFDTEAHRTLLLQNPTLSEQVKSQIQTDVRSALSWALFGYGPQQVFSPRSVLPPVTFQYDVKVSPLESSSALGNEATADFSGYDAIVFLETLPGDVSGSGVLRWPQNHPIFRTDEPLVLRINPRALSPGLFYNELFRRNVPVYLAQHLVGPPTFVEENGILYNRTPITNPRNGWVLRKEDFALLSDMLNGWHDVDGDGIPECQDTEIESRPDNVDADWVPDLIDPDLAQDNGPFVWTRG
ncbi:hypothetical protein ACN469_42125 [Corallococcus terminator]